MTPPSVVQEETHVSSHDQEQESGASESHPCLHDALHSTAPPSYLHLLSQVLEQTCTPQSWISELHPVAMSTIAADARIFILDRTGVRPTMNPYVPFLIGRIRYPKTVMFLAGVACASGAFLVASFRDDCKDAGRLSTQIDQHWECYDKRQSLTFVQQNTSPATWEVKCVCRK